MLSNENRKNGEKICTSVNFSSGDVNLEPFFIIIITPLPVQLHSLVTFFPSTPYVSLARHLSVLWWYDEMILRFCVSKAKRTLNIGMFCYYLFIFYSSQHRNI